MERFGCDHDISPWRDLCPVGRLSCANTHHASEAIHPLTEEDYGRSPQLGVLYLLDVPPVPAVMSYWARLRSRHVAVVSLEDDHVRGMFTCQT